VIKVGDRVRLFKSVTGYTYRIIHFIGTYAWLQAIEDPDVVPQTVHIDNLVVLEEFPVGALVSVTAKDGKWKVMQKYTSSNQHSFSVIEDGNYVQIARDSSLKLAKEPKPSKSRKKS
jgi:hypothetical protein